MKIVIALASILAALTAVLPTATAHDTRMRRGDLIVMGLLTTRNSEALDEFGISSAMTADLKISRVLRGRAPSETLTVRYIAHMELSEHRELRLHLRRTSAGTWIVCKDGDGQGYTCR